MLSALGPTNSCPLTNDHLWVLPGHSVCKCPLIIPRRTLKGLPGGSVVKNPSTKAGDVGSIPGQEDTLEKEMATHSSILAWEIPWTEESGWLQSMGLQRVRHGLASKQQQEGFKRGDSSEVVCEALISSSSFLPSQERNSEFFNL